jgi:hypothetical protein
MKKYYILNFVCFLLLAIILIALQSTILQSIFGKFTPSLISILIIFIAIKRIKIEGFFFLFFITYFSYLNSSSSFLFLFIIFLILFLLARYIRFNFYLTSYVSRVVMLFFLVLIYNFILTLKMYEGWYFIFINLIYDFVRAFLSAVLGYILISFFEWIDFKTNRLDSKIGLGGFK